MITMTGGSHFKLGTYVLGDDTNSLPSKCIFVNALKQARPDYFVP